MIYYKMDDRVVIIKGSDIGKRGTVVVGNNDFGIARIRIDGNIRISENYVITEIEYEIIHDRNNKINQILNNEV